MYCIECGSKIEETQKKCLRCGVEQPLNVFKNLNAELVASNNILTILNEINGAVKVIAKGTNTERIEKIKTMSATSKIIIGSIFVIFVYIFYVNFIPTRVKSLPIYNDVLSQYGECGVTLSLQAEYFASQNDPIALRVAKDAVAWGKTTIDMGMEIGFSREEMIGKNKAISAEYTSLIKDYTKKKNLPLEEFIRLLQDKMNGCLRLLKTDPELLRVFSKNINN